MQCVGVRRVVCRAGRCQGIDWQPRRCGRTERRRRTHAARAHRNLLENLLPFTAVALVASAVQVSNTITVVASLVFFGARLLHVLCYLFGIPGVRTLAYHLGVWATLAYALQLFL
ncbi:MAPEG family protein [Xanthomonas citri]|uniref:MAPEG family protein n=1 Tax=Xanthomonas citri TaxID=346 RepID=UPI001CC1AABB|nr:MAPEG family protein [Xanthomonas citri]